MLRSDGTFVRDYFYVEDAVDGLPAAGRADRRRPASSRRGVQLQHRAAGRRSIEIVGDHRRRSWASTTSPPVSSRRARSEINAQALVRRQGPATSWLAPPSIRSPTAFATTVDWYQAYLGRGRMSARRTSAEAAADRPAGPGRRSSISG